MKGSSILKKGKTVMVVLLMLLLTVVATNAQHQNPPSKTVGGDSTHVQQELLNCEPVKKYDNEIQAEDLVPAVSSEIVETYPGHEISKAYRAKDGSYKVKIDKGDEKVVVCYSINGELLSEENLEDNEEW